MFTRLTIKRTRFFFVPVWEIHDDGKYLVRFLSYEKADQWRQNVYDWEAKYARAMMNHPAGKGRKNA